MILDNGVCTVYRKTNTAAAGNMPVYEDEAYYQSWYGELNFETSSARPTENREEIQTDARIRVLQNREISNHDRVQLFPRGTQNAPRYEVLRAYHGRDDDSGELITDLTLRRVAP